MRRITKSLAVAAAVAGFTGLSVPAAFASTGPSTDVSASVGVAQVLGWQSAPSASINFGQAIPGQTATATESWAVTDNDSNGVSVTITPDGAYWKSTTGINDYTNAGFSGPNGQTPWQVTDTSVNGTAFTVSSLGSSYSGNALTDQSDATSGQTYTDNWSVALPSAMYPDTLTQSFTYTVIAN